MKNSIYIVSTTVNGVSRQNFWNGEAPLRLGYSLPATLEITQEGARLLTGNTSHPIPLGKPITLDGRISLQIRQANMPPAPYHSGQATDKTLIQRLLVFTGAGRGIFGFDTVLGAYVAYMRGRPVFTMKQDGGRFEIRSLLAGVRIKPRGAKSILMEPDQVANITSEQLLTISVLRGSNWWRFQYAGADPEVEQELREFAWLDESSLSFRRMLIFTAILLGLGIGAVLLTNEPKKPPTEPVEAPIVKFVLPKSNPEPKPAVADFTHVTTIQAPPAPAPVAVNEPKTESTPDTPKPIDPRIKAQAAAAKKVAQLKDALGGLAGLIARKSAPMVPGSKERGHPALGLGASKIVKTDIAPQYTTGNVKVGGIGGGPGAYNGADQGTTFGGVRPGGFVSVEAGGPTVQEGLSKEEVGAVIHSHMDQVRYCHETAMLYQPKIEGKLVVDFVINGQGAVISHKIIASSVPNGLGQCILSKLKQWSFPKPKGGVTVSVSYPFIFKTLGRE